jgi:GNAT superfamily N-acetyltransferase
MIHARHADVSLARRFLQLAAGQAGEAGIALRRRHDMEALAAINRANRESWPPLIPLFDAAESAVTPDTALWVDATNDQGETIGTYAARFFHWPHSTLAEEARSLRIFYADPAPHLARGEYIDLPDDVPGAVITGRTAATGALWIRPDYRRLGLTKILSRACMAYAFELWEPAVFWSIANAAHLDSGVARAWGSLAFSRGAWLCLGGLDLSVALSVQDHRRFLADIAKDMRQGRIESSRLTVTALMNTADWRPRQGMRSRS